MGAGMPGLSLRAETAVPINIKAKACSGRIYSYLSAVIGSSRAARRAGI
jgi:hypothetical protein